MSKQDRLFFIMNLLRGRKNLNAERLAKECGVTERSIYRDIISLSESNIPIYYDNGYKLASDNFLPPLNFDFDEYTCLRLALESSPLRKTGKYKPVLKQITAKIEANLSQAVKDRRRTSVDTTRIEIESTVEGKQSLKFYAPIEQAVTERQCLKLTYDAIESGAAERVVEPYFIIFRRRSFYFVAYCRLRKEFRTFRMDRVLNIELLDEHFRPQAGINAETYFEGSWEVYSGKPVDVAVRFSGNAARLVASSPKRQRSSVEESKNGEIIYRVTVRGTEEIKRWILGFGDQAVVLEPIELREELGRIGGHLVGEYGGESGKKGCSQ